MQVEVYEKLFRFAEQMTASANVVKELAKHIPDEQDALGVAEVHIMELRADVFYQILLFIQEEETDESARLHKERVALQRKFFDPDGSYGSEIDSLIPGRLPSSGRSVKKTVQEGQGGEQTESSQAMEGNAAKPRSTKPDPGTEH
jgi:hypothetical protein